MGKCGANFEVGPTTAETLACFVGGDVDRVLIDGVDLSQRLDEIDGVAFVAPELRSDSVGVDRDPQTLPQKLSATNKHKSLFLAGSRGLSIVAVTARVALTDACGLTAQSTQVVKLRASDATAFYEIDVVDDRRV